MNIAQAGDRAVLVSFEDISAGELRGRADQIERLPGIAKVIIGHSSLYVIFEDHPDIDVIRRKLLTPADDLPAAAIAHHRITVSFHEAYAPDLPQLLARIGLTRDAFLARVPSITLQARYLGFRGGFAYLDGWPGEWALPRRPTSRHVLAGSFAIAGAVAGFYPIDTPGGWNILGRTNSELAITPGDEISIRTTLALLDFKRPIAPPSLTLRHAELLQAPASRVITADSAFDLEAAALAAHAVGNRSDAPLLECALVVPRIRVTANAIASWYGADADLRVNNQPVADVRQFELRAGDEVTGGRVRNGMRGYLAFGSHRGSVVSMERRNRLAIATMRGPHDVGLMTIECEVTPKLDRVGIRLTPIQPISVEIPADLPSSGMQCGTLQLHPDGTIVAMGPDHPVTGGYLQPMTVLSSERWKLAQLMPGDRVRFIAQLP